MNMYQCTSTVLPPQVPVLGGEGEGGEGEGGPRALDTSEEGYRSAS